MTPDQPLVACACVGPQRGEPRCPCGMRGVVARAGRWVQLEVDLGPVQPVSDVLVRSATPVIYR